jgi:hypothetical protein
MKRGKERITLPAFDGQLSCKRLGHRKDLKRRSEEKSWTFKDEKVRVTYPDNH